MSKKRKKPKPAHRVKRSRKLTRKKPSSQIKKSKFYRDKMGRFSKRIAHRKVKRIAHRKVKRIVHRKVKRIAHRKVKRVVHRKKVVTYRGAKREQIGFLVEHHVPHEAFTLDHSIHFVDGEPVVGIDATTLKNITNDFRHKFNRGAQFARLLIEYHVGRGKGKKRLNYKWVSTPRILLNDDDSYQDLLSAFLSLSIPLYEYDATYFGEEKDTSIKIIVHRVHIELFNLEVEPSIEL